MGTGGDQNERPAICVAFREHREGAGWTQGRLAEALGVHQQQIVRWEHDRQPALDVIAAAEAALGLDRGDILRAAGYVEDRDGKTTEDIIAKDPRLTRVAREMVLAAYRGVARPRR
jgi:transcriptional regulator with XRE-family HTH domain